MSRTGVGTAAGGGGGSAEQGAPAAVDPRAGDEVGRGSPAGNRLALDPQAVWAEARAAKVGDAALQENAGGPAQEEFQRRMAEPQFSTHQDDDLPRTLRRERDARAQARANQEYDMDGLGRDLGSGDGPGVTVTRFDVPFLRLMLFFIKAVLAAIPALIMLGLILFLMGNIAHKLFPWLIKMRIMITFP
jgi:hypothetical protein